MHMADALLSPAVGGTMWAVTGVTVAHCAKKMKSLGSERLVPLMGVLGAFVFAAQMINFSIPATGSSGHLGGGLLLAAILGPHAAFIVIASVLVVQALFFADGGLLALGCNIFNLGFFPAFVAYPLIFKPIVQGGATRGRLFAASILASVVGLELGALGVVVETVMSGITDLPFTTFASFMLPIHLAIGIVEGVVTALVVGFVLEANPRVVFDPGVYRGDARTRFSTRTIVAAFAIVAAITGSVISWYASEHPDGLEWSLAKTTGSEELNTTSPIHEALASLQDRIAPLPDYSFRATQASDRQPSPKAGTTVSGLVGAALVLLFAMAGGFILSRLGKKAT